MRRLGRCLGVVVVACAMLAALTPPATTQETDLEQIVCAVDPVLLERSWRGYIPSRSGNIQLITEEPDFIGQGGLPHSGPWDYIADVPLVWYGPGQVADAGRVDRRVTLADIAPTQAAFIDFPFDAPDGEPLTEVPADPAAEPKLLVVLVWDAAGNVVLDEWPDAWPELRSIMDDGTWYANAEVGSSPPSTAQIHATIGTGAFSRNHGLIGHHFRIGDTLVAPWKLGPRLLTAATLGDLYDRALDNAPVVGTVGMVDLHLGMMSHGSLWGGGDRDVAALRQLGSFEDLAPDGPDWTLNKEVEDFYEFPAYLNDLPTVPTYIDDVDRADGKADGKWLDDPFDDPRSLYGFNTPARIPWQERAIEEVIDREGFGTDEVTDLLFLNFKLTDEIGHTHTLNSEYMRDAVAAQDEALGQLIAYLNEHVGQGEWVLTVTADHGHTPDPIVTGATAITPGSVAAAVDAEFDLDDDDVRVVDFTQPTMMHVDVTELEEHGGTLEDVSRFIMTLTKGQVRSDQWPGPDSEVNDLAFLAAFPSTMLDTLDCVPRDD